PEPVPVEPEPLPAAEPERKPVVTARTPPPVASAPDVLPPPPAPSAPGIPLSDLAVPDFGASPAEETAQKARLPERATRRGLPTTAEALFLRRAEEALRSGRCGSYLLGLGDITETSEDRSSRETARILRARCFDDRLDPVKAEAEYRKYLDRHPTGRFADEARKALTR
ncbi:MAG: hypothetical protein WBV82_18935, partial [Myxococcaceae bacterium]